jgi:hypothetical protein
MGSLILVSDYTRIVKESDLSFPKSNTVQASADVDKIQLPREHAIKLVGVYDSKANKENALIC